MGLDLHICAERDAIVPIQGKMKAEHRFKQKINFHAWNLSHAQSLAVVSTEDAAAQYIEIIEEKNICVNEDTFAEDDLSPENPIGTLERNLSQEHIQEFLNWLKYCDENGYIVKFSVW